MSAPEPRGSSSHDQSTATFENAFRELTDNPGARVIAAAINLAGVRVAEAIDRASERIARALGQAR